MINWGKERLATIEAVLTLLVAWILVFIVPFRITAAWFGSATVPGSRPLSADGQIARAQAVTRRLVRLAARVPWRTTCLVQAVAGRLLLKRRGIESVVRFGVNKSEEGFTAHAWLIVGNEVVLGGAAAPDFQPLADLGTGTHDCK